MGTKTITKLVSEFPLPPHAPPMPIQKTTLKAQNKFERREQEGENVGFSVDTMARMVCESPHSVEALAQWGVLQANEIS